MPKIDVKSVFERRGSAYPPPFDQIAKDRVRQRLGDAAGITQFGVNLLRLPPGVWSSQRHWHTKQDEFVYVVSGEVTLVTNDGEEILKAGECAGFKAGDDNGHHLQNRSNAEVLVLEVGTRNEGDSGPYSDIDMMVPPDGKPVLYVHKDGTPYTDIRRRGPGDD